MIDKVSNQVNGVENTIISHKPEKNSLHVKFAIDKAGEIIGEEFEKLNDNQIIFYKPSLKDGEVKDVIIDYVGLIAFFYFRGYRRYDRGVESIFVKVKSNVIKQVTNQQILDDLIEYIDSLPEILLCKHNGKVYNIPKGLLKEKIFRCPQNYCSPQKLALLKNKDEIIFNSDTKNDSFIYYKNGFVICTKDGWELKPYSELKGGYIWENQIINRDFIKEDLEDKDITDLSVFAQFAFNVSNKNEPRYESLCSIIGYLLSSFTDTKLKAIILTDSSLSELSNGRTGKTLLGDSFQHIKKTTPISGKDFDPANRYKYQQVDLDTQIVLLNDVRKNFDFEVLYNDITEGIKVEKKNQTPFILKTKLCISTNKTIKIEGGSSEDRCIEFEFSDHYHAGFGPDNEFGHRFFSEWSKEQWNQFDNFMMYCLSVYLGNGIIKPVNMNLNKRKLLEETDPLFVEFMEEKIKDKTILFGQKCSKSLLHDKFLEEYPEFKDDKRKGRQQTFTTWLKKFAIYDERFDSVTKEEKSGAERSITFFPFKK